MTLMIELRPDIEARLASFAAGQGVPVAEYAAHLLELHMSTAASTPLSPAQRAALWLESAKNLPQTPPLPDAAISRETMYSDRG